jgi:hypothetical protein
LHRLMIAIFLAMLTKIEYFISRRPLSCGRMIGRSVIVTIDSDFLPVIEAAKEAGVQVTLYYSQSSIHDELLSAVDESAVIDQNIISKVTR